jgi:hypothetical protein
VEKFRRARQASVDNIIRRMRFANWLTKTTDTNTQILQHLLLFHGNNGYSKALQYYVIRALPLF